MTGEGQIQSSPSPAFVLQRVVSGGQTGVDRAALDAAMAAGIAVGGWCPRGRRAEDGVIPPQYPLRETASDDPAERTRLNVRDSDATLILVVDVARGGTLRTKVAARELRRPYHVARVSNGPQAALRWLERVRPTTLNVAGPRASEHVGLYDATRTFLDALFARLSGSPRLQGACD